MIAPDFPEWARTPGREDVSDSLVALTYIRDLPGGHETTDITNVVLSVDLDLSQLDLNGGYVDFWFTTYQGRFHVDVPLVDGHNSVAIGNIIQSWARDAGPMDQVAELTAVESFGFAINGYSAKPVGNFLFDNFVLATPLEVIGTDGGDEVVGNSGNDRLFGLDGNDRLWNFDELIGGAGRDIFTGGIGEDTAAYHNSDERVRIVMDGDSRYGDADGDLFGSIENIIGSRLSDEIFTDNGDNTIWGLEGDDIIQAGTGSDIIVGGAGRDMMSGEEGAT